MSNSDLSVEFSWFSEVKNIPTKELYTIEKQFKEDQYSFKLDLAFPCYRDENGKPWVLPVVRTAEKVLANDRSLSKEYINIFGYESFNSSATAILLGEHCSSRVENRAFSIQTVSATGAIRMGAEFLATAMGRTTVYSSQQSMEYVDSTFLTAGFKEHEQLSYLNRHTLTLDINGLLMDLNHAKDGSVVFLQVVGHNPTGFDPSMSDWELIANIIAKKRLFPFFYSPNQGFVSGDLDQDAQPIRMFEKKGFEFFCAQSFSWNFSLYNDRIGCLTVVVNNINTISAIKSNLLYILRNSYASPPAHGARIVSYIWGDKMLTEQWTEALVAIADRLKKMRLYLREELERLGAPGTWQHITNQVGIFCLTGLSEIQVEHLKKQYHIYMLVNGRLNVSGLNLDNVEYVARSICETLNLIPPSYIMNIVM